MGLGLLIGNGLIREAQALPDFQRSASFMDVRLDSLPESSARPPNDVISTNDYMITENAVMAIRDGGLPITIY